MLGNEEAPQVFDFLKHKNSYSFSDGTLAMQRGDRKKARDIWLELGRCGDVRAQLALAAWYTDEVARGTRAGSDVKPDLVQAVEWGKKAADQGHIEAQLWLGNMAQMNGWVEEQLKAFSRAERVRVMMPFDDFLWPLQLKAYEGRGLTASNWKSFQCYWANEYLTRFPRGIAGWDLFTAAIQPNLNHEQALIYLRKVVDLNPEFGEACFFLGANAVSLGRTDEAIAAFRRAVSGKWLFGLLTEGSWGMLGAAYAKCGEEEKHRECLRWLEEHAPSLAGSIRR
jgi:tetratricopeptide (TPR) repeat protein